MAGERRFTRIPPESSGDRVGMNAFLDVGYNGATGSFNVGDTVSFVTSGLGGQVSYVRVDTGTTGLITIDLDDTSREAGTVASVTENIQVDGITIAQAATIGDEIYLPKYNLASGDNPIYLQRVDEQGSAQIRFADGPAQLDAFGKLRTSSTTVIGEYNFSRNLIPAHFGQAVATGGTITHDTAGQAVLTTTTTSGSSTEFRSHLWHHYIPGISTMGMFSLFHGDAGKTNNVRRWGLFDDFNGVFFELNGTTLYTVVRSNVSGSVVETRFAQTDWNVDKLDGSGGAENKTNITLDITNINLYWIDYEWLGAGQIRWGIFSGGQRITCHTYNHAASSPWSKYGSYPITFENENTGAAGSGSELRIVCCAVHSESDDAHQIEKYGRPIYATRDLMQVNSTPFYVGSIRTTPNTHDAFILTDIDTIAVESGNSAGVMLEYYLGPTIGTPTWTAINSENLEIDTAGTVSSNGVLLAKTFTFGEKTNKPTSLSLQQDAYKCYANGDPFVVAVYATRIDGSTANCAFDIQMTFKAIENQYG